MALAISEPTAEATDNSDGTSYAPLAAYTPTANALQVVMVAAAGTTAAGTMTGGGMTWTRQVSQASGAGTTVYIFTAQAGASPSSCDPTFDCTGDGATGVTMAVLEVTGHNSSSPIAQVGTGAANAANPVATMAGAMNTNNAYIGAVGVNRAAPAYTPPGSWTETCDTGHTTPNGGMEVAYRIGGETGTTVTWTGSSGNYAAAVIEIAAGGAYTITAASGSFAITGNATGLKWGRNVTALSGSYASTGNVTGLLYGRKVSAAAGSYAVTGSAAGALWGRKLTAAAGSYAITGNDADLIHTVPGAYSVTAEAGAYAVTGRDVSLTYQSVSTVDTHDGFAPVSEREIRRYWEQRRRTEPPKRQKKRRQLEEHIREVAEKPVSQEALEALAAGFFESVPMRGIEVFVANLLVSLDRAISAERARAEAAQLEAAERERAEVAARERTLLRLFAHFEMVLEADEVLMMFVI